MRMSMKGQMPKRLMQTHPPSFWLYAYPGHLYKSLDNGYRPTQFLLHSVQYKQIGHRPHNSSKTIKPQRRVTSRLTPEMNE
jgi:hypothetical protein